MTKKLTKAEIATMAEGAYWVHSITDTKYRNAKKKSSEENAKILFNSLNVVFEDMGVVKDDRNKIYKKFQKLISKKTKNVKKI